MTKDLRGKKRVCPFCNSLFYDMNKEVIVCPKCNKKPTSNDELEFIKKKKKAEIKIKEAEDKIMESFIDNDSIDMSESEMFFDMDNEEGLSKQNYTREEEDY